MKNVDLPDHIYLQACRSGITFRRRQKNRPTYNDLLVGLRSWAKTLTFHTAETSFAYVCSISVVFPNGIKLNNLSGFSINKRSAGKRVDQIDRCQRQTLAHAIKIIYECTSRR